MIVPPPPTHSDPVLVDPRTKKAKFNPIWLGWFLAVARELTIAASGSAINHENLAGLQGGLPGQHNHLTDAQLAGLGGTVTSVSVATANGFTATVLTPTTTPSIAIWLQQAAHIVKAAAATLTVLELFAGILQYTGAAANISLPTGTQIDAAFPPATPVDRAFEVSVINTGSGAATIIPTAGFTAVGSMVVANGTSASFRIRKTLLNTFTIYRMS